MDTNKQQKQRRFWLGMIISIICLAAIFLFISPAEILAALKTAQYQYIFYSAFGILLFMIFRAVRWRFLLNDEVNWSTTFHIQNIGYMLTKLLPLRIGDVARAILIGNVPPVTIGRGISTMVVERVMDMIIIITLLPFTLAAVPTLPGWIQTGARVSGVAALIAIAILIIAANQRPFVRRLSTWGLNLLIRAARRLQSDNDTLPNRLLRPLARLNTDVWVERLDNLLAGLDTLTHFKSGVLLILLTIIVWLPILFSYYNVLRAVNLDPNLAMAGFVMCAAALSIAAPSSPGQIGVFHAGVIAALQLMGQPEAESASFAFIYHALDMIMMVLLGVIGIYRTGSTFNRVVESTRAFMNRQETNANTS